MSYKISMSYVITTRNKLPYLTEVMKRLLENVKEDEEIIVTDGASTDGTVEFLTELYKEGKIHKFISEPDKGEAHGYNKAILLAEGELIKIITDDDVFDYEAIGEMKDYMLRNTDVDVVTGNILSVNITISPIKFDFRKNYEVWFREWKDRKVVNSFFSGLPLMIRKSSFSFLGLFNINYKHLDLEFSVRITSMNAKIVFYTGIVAIGIVNEKSISKNYSDLVKDTIIDMYKMYEYEDKRGVKLTTNIWLKKHLIDKIPILRQQFNKRKWLMPKVIYYPNYNIIYEKEYELEKKSVKDIFELVFNTVKELGLIKEAEFIVN